jgi:DNA-binding MarR family transcriptional regulator
MRLSQPDFERLLALRTGLRRFLRWSEREAQASGLTPAQHQLLLAIAGHPDPAGPAIGDVAEHLVLRHHSAVGLVDRAAAAGLVERHPDEHNHSVIRLALTESGFEMLDRLTEAHLEELKHLAPAMRSLWLALDSPAERRGALSGSGGA